MSGSELSRGKELSQAPYAGAGPVANDKRSARNALPDGKAEPPVIACFEDLIALAAEKRDLGVKLALERDVRLVRCEDGRLEIQLEEPPPGAWSTIWLARFPSGPIRTGLL